MVFLFSNPKPISIAAAVRNPQRTIQDGNSGTGSEDEGVGEPAPGAVAITYGPPIFTAMVIQFEVA